MGVVEFRVAYDGTTPGLAEHRLSLAAFATPLQLLLAALQRTASALLRDALDDPDYGSRGGRFAKEATLLDLELAAIEDGSAAPRYVCTARPDELNPQTELFHDLPVRALKRLVENIDAECANQQTNASVRKYLGSLPDGVVQQEYVATVDGRVFASTVIRAVNLSERFRPLPRVIQIIGDIISVGFEPGSTFVTVKSNKRPIRCVATPNQVDVALLIRREKARAAILDDDENARLLWIRAEGAPSSQTTVAETLRHIDEVWAETMRDLAR